MSYFARIIYNKKTGQPIVSLSKRKLKKLKKKKYNWLKVNEEDIL